MGPLSMGPRAAPDAGLPRRPRSSRGRARRPVLAALVAGVASLHLYASPAEGTVEDQRAHLPPAEECGDPIEGVWASKKYVDIQGEWYEFTLEIHRKPGTPELTGQIRSHFWAGAPTTDVVPPCGPSGREAFVTMPGTGTLTSTPTGDEMIFGATTHTLDRVVCGEKSILYRPDHFTGKIDRARQEFQSVNNDGGALLDDPTVFRRIQCFGGAPTVPPLASSEPAPPPKPASTKPTARGCGCSF